MKGVSYGTTSGEREQACRGNNGSVFRLSVNGNERLLRAFSGGDDGNAPYGGLLYDHGRLYGVAQYGGQYTTGTLFALKR